MWKSASKVGSLAHTMVAVFLQLKQTLSNHKHYLFTPKDLTSWCIEMMRYLFAASSQDHKSVLEVFTYQARRLFKDKLVNVEDKDKFDSVIKNVLQVWPLLMQFVFLFTSDSVLVFKQQRLTYWYVKGALKNALPCG